ncbi:hypothetical protein HHI36_011528 [Cryptolaemus montrouzieri]|uniref:Uncharacterized protein n=1 Tax=Cryptolaemus montrouzieri TaxID=559131 RepID=A0ABD2MLY3_9CUCU
MEIIHHHDLVLPTVKMYISAILVLPILRASYCQDITFTKDIRTLSELPLERLLELKRSFQINDDNLTQVENRIDRFNGPEALALQSKNPSRGGYEHEHYEYEEYDKKGDKKSVQNFFQLAVTALAFLAFGGYLLCLIVQAIKSKQMDQMTQMANMQMMASLLRRQATRRPALRPRRTKPTRNTKKRGNKRPRREAEIWPKTDPENMYYALVTLSEAYKSYHTIDYKHYNNTRYFT